jgi:hypothetical protein
MKLYACCILSVFAPLAGAAEVPVSEILYIAPFPAHVDVEMNTTAIDPENCGAAVRYRIDLTGAGSQEKVATLLTAFAMGKSVGLSISGCVLEAPKIVAIRLYQ